MKMLKQVWKQVVLLGQPSNKESKKPSEVLGFLFVSLGSS